MHDAGADYDLLAAAKAWKNKSRYGKLAHIIEQLHAVSSALLDLRRARDSFSAIVSKYTAMPNVAEVGQSENDALTGSALLCTGVIFYARATETQGKARRTSGVRDRLPKESLSLHKEAMELRNEALAHFSGGGDGWAKEGVVLRVTEEHAQVFTPYSRLNYRGLQAEAFLGLTEAAISIAEAIREEKVGALYKELNDLQPDIASDIQRFPFDPNTVFGHDSGKDMWRSQAPAKAGVEQRYLRKSERRLGTD